MGNAFSKPPPSGPELWRSADEIPKLAREIGSFKDTAIAAFGPVGVGKSSFLNTTASYVGDAWTGQAAAGVGTKSLTPTLTAHRVTFNGHHTQWQWIDTAGDTFDQLVERQRRAMLPETDPDHCSADSYEKHLDQTVLIPLQQQRVGCVMVIVSGSEIWEQAATSGHDRDRDQIKIVGDCAVTRQMKVIKHLQEKLAHRSMRLVCIVTKMDTVDNRIKEHVANLRNSWPAYRVREWVSQSSGVPMNQVFPVVNMVSEFHPRDNMPLGYLTLLTVHAALLASRSANDERRSKYHGDAADFLWDVVTDPSTRPTPVHTRGSTPNGSHAGTSFDQLETELYT